jgi:23S rRNA pseudouridine1911/1915/1917 synthase
MRVDVFLQTQLRNTSRTRAKAIVENSAFDWFGRRLRASDRVRAEGKIALWRAPFEDDEAELPPLNVVFEDAHLLAIDKPPLVTVHPTARHHNHTVIKRLQTQRPGEFLSLIHRIDRETSGLLLIAKSPEADRAFKRLLEDRSVAEMARADNAFALVDARERKALMQRARKAARVDKVYLAITWGVPDAVIVDKPVEADVDNPLRVKMRIARSGSGLDARTGLRVLETRAGYALVACELFTGRQHQIRLHLASIGCAIVGDKLYGPDERLLARAADGLLDDDDLSLLELNRHALHAHRYVLPHPFTAEVLTLEAPLAPDLQAFWSRLAPE